MHLLVKSNKKEFHSILQSSECRQCHNPSAYNLDGVCLPSSCNKLQSDGAVRTVVTPDCTTPRLTYRHFQRGGKKTALNVVFMSRQSSESRSQVARPGVTSHTSSLTETSSAVTTRASTSAASRSREQCAVGKRRCRQIFALAKSIIRLLRGSPCNFRMIYWKFMTPNMRRCIRIQQRLKRAFLRDLISGGGSFVK